MCPHTTAPLQEALKQYVAAAAASGAAREEAQEACESCQERLRVLGMFRQACQLADSAPNDCLTLCQSLLAEVRSLHPPPLNTVGLRGSVYESHSITVLCCAVKR